MNYVDEITSIFKETRCRYSAHHQAAPLLAQASKDKDFFTQVLAAHLKDRSVYDRLNYPVLAIPIAKTRDFELVANCWIPLPDRGTDLSTKSIHHHGQLLLTTVTCHGPGYEHWLFERPQIVDTDTNLWSTRLLNRDPHRPHLPAFVDAYTAHVPFYPPSLSITYALWSHRSARSWADALKQLSWIRRYKDSLIALGGALKLTNKLNLNVVEYFDFYPSPEGLHVIKSREEFPRGPNEDYLHSLFHVIQETGNQDLLPLVDQTCRQAQPANAALVGRLSERVSKGECVEGRLSNGHINVATANFSSSAILTMLPLASAKRS